MPRLPEVSCLVFLHNWLFSDEKEWIRSLEETVVKFAVRIFPSDQSLVRSVLSCLASRFSLRGHRWHPIQPKCSNFVTWYLGLSANPKGLSYSGCYAKTSSLVVCPSM